MTRACEWCGEQGAELVSRSVFWELPEGTKSIEITDTPTIRCPACGIEYQSDRMTKEIEDQLYLIDRRQLEKEIGYHAFMALPRILKRNYFDFE